MVVRLLNKSMNERRIQEYGQFVHKMIRVNLSTFLYYSKVLAKLYIDPPIKYMYKQLYDKQFSFLFWCTYPTPGKPELTKDDLNKLLIPADWPLLDSETK